MDWVEWEAIWEGVRLGGEKGLEGAGRGLEIMAKSFGREGMVGWGKSRSNSFASSGSL